MRSFAGAASLVLALTSSALAADKQSADVADPWYVACYGRRCSMSHNLLGKEPGAAPFEITLGLHFDRSTGKLSAVAAKAPPDADHDRGIEISFMDGSDPQKTTVAFTVPLAPCDDTGCMGSIEFGPSAGRDLQADFVENVMKHQVLAVSYHTKGQRKAAMENARHFRAEYPNLLAEMKKPQ